MICLLAYVTKAGDLRICNDEYGHAGRCGGREMRPFIGGNGCDACGRHAEDWHQDGCPEAAAGPAAVRAGRQKEERQ